MTLWIIYLTSTHPKLSKNVYVYCIVPSSLFTTSFLFYFKGGKKPSTSTGAECAILWHLNELMSSDAKEHIRDNL